MRMTFLKFESVLQGFIIHSKYFWLPKGTRIIHHNQLKMTKFGRICV